MDQRRHGGGDGGLGWPLSPGRVGHVGVCARRVPSPHDGSKDLLGFEFCGHLGSGPSSNHCYHQAISRGPGWTWVNPGVRGSKKKTAPLRWFELEPADPSQVPAARSPLFVPFSLMPCACDFPSHTSVCHLKEQFQLPQSPHPQRMGCS